MSGDSTCFVVYFTLFVNEFSHEIEDCFISLKKNLRMKNLST
jgi:hypothetical protein